MAKFFVNRSLDLSQEQTWTAQNGATRRALVLVSKFGANGPVVDEKTPFEASFGKLIKGNHGFIYLNPVNGTSSDNRVLGIFLNQECGYEVKQGEELFSCSSVGGVGNSESKFGIYEEGALLYVTSYMNRKPAAYYKLTKNGWVKMPAMPNTQETGVSK